MSIERCIRRGFLCCTALLLCVTPILGDPKPLGKKDQAKVDKAIDKAVSFLKRKQTKEGDWPRQMAIWNDRYLVGQTLLPAYALLEAGVPANDPVIQKAADFIRSNILKSEQTYELSLGVLFFDRLGEPKDKKLIQTLALRLVAGEHRTGGWNYRCPTLREADEEPLLMLLEELAKRQKAGESLNAKALNALHIPTRLKPLTVFQDPKRLRWVEPISGEFSRHSQLFVGTTDNSNTQFAMLGLWAAQRHELPVKPAFRLMVERFEKMQRKDGWWPYNLRFDQRDPSSSSMICVGLIGLAIGHGNTRVNPKPAQPKSEDNRVLNGLVALYHKIGLPSGDMDKPVPLQKMYSLWSVERVAMLYNLPTLGDKDWYRWGAEMLIVNQKAGGDWGVSPIQEPGGQPSYGALIDVSFALLFLKRSHPMRDLTPKLPFTAKELNEGIARRLSKGSIGEKSMSTLNSSTMPER